ncbi:hypothetical protein GOV10_02920, partial [Candidatus Woesearchaeota archaeon]|nr:hypothetical protein [Candidatus Woesearchaeota archaeon]
MSLLIPWQLQDDSFKFCLIKPREKGPYEKGWQTIPRYHYQDKKLLGHLKEGGNYGVRGGHGNLIVIDADIQD